MVTLFWSANSYHCEREREAGRAQTYVLEAQARAAANGRNAGVGAPSGGVGRQVGKVALEVVDPDRQRAGRDAAALVVMTCGRQIRSCCVIQRTRVLDRDGHVVLRREGKGRLDVLVCGCQHTAGHT